MSRRLSNDHFQSGPDSTVQEMTAVRRAVGFTNDHMGVEHRFAILFYNVPNKGKNFDLFLYGNFLITFLFSIKEAKRDFTESADGSGLCSSESVFSNEAQQGRFGFLVFIEHERESFQAVFIMQQFRFHTAI